MKAKKNNKAEKKPKKPFWQKPEKVVNINSENYIKPKNDLWKKALSFVFWIMIVFIFAQGVAAALRPDPLSEMQQRTDTFIKEQTEQANLSFEIQSFAQNFAKEYLTYQAGQRDDYVKRVKPYISAHVSFADIQNFKNNATAIYLQAYKLQQYNRHQFDVYVMATIEYNNTQFVASEALTLSQKENTYMKVPVRVLGQGKYIVEDYPAFVAAPDASEYTATPFNAREVDKNINLQIQQVLSNFFTAYYQENQTRIEYFLAVNADREVFKGLNGRYKFKEIKNVRSFADPMSFTSIVSLVELVVEDYNGQQLTQRFNVLINHDGDRFYIVQMDTKTVDIKYNFSIQ